MRWTMILRHGPHTRRCAYRWRLYSTLPTVHPLNCTILWENGVSSSNKKVGQKSTNNFQKPTKVLTHFNKVKNGRVLNENTSLFRDHKDEVTKTTIVKVPKRNPYTVTFPSISSQEGQKTENESSIVMYLISVNIFLSE